MITHTSVDQEHLVVKLNNMMNKYQISEYEWWYVSDKCDRGETVCMEYYALISAISGGRWGSPRKSDKDMFWNPWDFDII